MIGTTQFLNAFVQRRDLARVAVIRVSLPKADGIPPLTGWPDDLVSALSPEIYQVGGGSFYTGQEYAPLDEEALRSAAADIRRKGLSSIAISANFAPMRPDIEERAAAIVRSIVKDATITLSAQVGGIGLIDRENATVHQRDARSPVEQGRRCADRRTGQSRGTRAGLYQPKRRHLDLRGNRAAIPNPDLLRRRDQQYPRCGVPHGSGAGHRRRHWRHHDRYRLSGARIPARNHRLQLHRRREDQLSHARRPIHRARGRQHRGVLSGRDDRGAAIGRLPHQLQGAGIRRFYGHGDRHCRARRAGEHRRRTARIGPCSAAGGVRARRHTPQARNRRGSNQDECPAHTAGAGRRGQHPRLAHAERRVADLAARSRRGRQRRGRRHCTGQRAGGQTL